MSRVIPNVPAAGAILAAVMMVAVAGGCASEPPQSPSNKEVRTNSDRYFDKMKQEEREHNKGTQGGGY